MPLSSSEAEERSFQLGSVFKPATPISRADLFKGRKRQMQDVVDAINQNGLHVVLFGEHGVGKTSLANMLFPKLYSTSGSPTLTPHISCTTQDTFTEIWKRVFNEIKFKIETSKDTFPVEAVELLNNYTEDFLQEISSDHIRRALTEVAKSCILVVIIDEFDRVESTEVRQTMADTLKFLSDKIVPATVVLIGVADNVEQLIKEHQSTERCLIQVKMPRMSEIEISAIVTAALSLQEMTIEPNALARIAYLSKGLPHYAHLLGLHSGREALKDLKTAITKDHVLRGIRVAIERAQASVQGNYREAVSTSRKDAQYKQVLLACSMAPTDEFGFFAPVDVRGPLSKVKHGSSKIEAFARTLHAFSEPERGPVLERIAYSKRRIRFRFLKPLLQPYILLRGVSDGMISEDELENSITLPKTDDDCLF